MDSQPWQILDYANQDTGIFPFDGEIILAYSDTHGIRELDWVSATKEEPGHWNDDIGKVIFWRPLPAKKTHTYFTKVELKKISLELERGTILLVNVILPARNVKLVQCHYDPLTNRWITPLGIFSDSSVIGGFPIQDVPKLKSANPIQGVFDPLWA